MSETAEPIKPRRRRWLFIVLFGFVAALGAAVLVDQSEAFTDCVHDRKDRKEYQALRERSGILGGAISRLGTRARLSYVCTWYFTDKNNGALIALATIALSAFTFTLWQATDRLWRTSQEHARHLER